MPLSNITSSTYFQSYISNEISETVGALTIIDNTNNNISNLPDSYSLFIDDTFIATGYGATSYEDFSNMSYVISSYNQVFSYFDDEINKIYDHYVRITYSNNIVLSKEINEYGFTTSYTVLKVNHTASSRESNDFTNSYSINQETKACKHLSNVSFEYDTTNSGETSCAVKLSYNIVSGDEEEINNNIELRLLPAPTELSDNTIYPTMNFEGNSGNIALNFEISENKIIDDLTLQFVKNNNVIYSYTYKNLLKWPTSSYTFPEIATDTANYFNNLNTFNFRNSNLSDTEIQSIIIDVDHIISNLTSTPIEEKELVITFTNSSPSYDYIVLFKDYTLNTNIEFFFNGIRSNNWRCISDVENNRYIWQSPQKYIGTHDWTIKFK